MPLLLIVAGAAILVAAGAVAWAVDESSERKKEQKLGRSKIADIERKNDDIVEGYKQLQERLGEKVQQVRELALLASKVQRVQRLQRNLAAACRRVAAWCGAKFRSITGVMRRRRKR